MKKPDWYDKADATFGELLEPAMEITTKREAREYFGYLVAHSMEHWGKTRQEAEDIERYNLRFWASLDGKGAQARVERLFFGTTGEAKEYSLAIRYDGDDDNIILEALNPSRFTHHGFGTFLENVNPQEITISKAALGALLSCPERSGLQGLEFWPDNRLAWGDPSPLFTVPCDAINCPDGAKTWLKLCNVYEDIEEEGQ